MKPSVKIPLFIFECVAEADSIAIWAGSSAARYVIVWRFIYTRFEKVFVPESLVPR